MSIVEQATSKFGESLGCFRSEETVVLRGSRQAAAQPLEYAYAINIPSGPYSASDVEAWFLKVSEQWSSYSPLDQQARADHDKWINDFVRKIVPAVASGKAVSTKPPVLVSIRRIGTEAYVVISLRQRKLTLEGDVIVSTAVDASAITLKGDRLLRLSFVRELRAPADVSHVDEAITEWIRTVGAAGTK